MFVRFVRRWRGHVVGKLLDISDGVATTLIRYGHAVEEQPVKKTRGKKRGSGGRVSP
jgi:hypothetical protein